MACSLRSLHIVNKKFMAASKNEITIGQFVPEPRLYKYRRGRTGKAVTAVVHWDVLMMPGSRKNARKSLLVPKEIVKEKEKPNMSGGGRFGKYGGVYVPEILVTCLSQLESEFYAALTDPQFQEELTTALEDYAGRETPLYHAKRLTDFYKNDRGQGPEIYLKREDLNHCGAHKINNAIGQAMLAKRMGRKSIIAATGAGQHGVATAAACAKLGLDCTIFMGSLDIERQSSNVLLIKLLGGEVESVEGNFKDAASQAIKHWVENLESSYYLTGTVVGPHPCPTIVREFQSIIGKETRKQAMEKWGGKPDVLLACVGSGSNALGLFHEFIGDEDVRLIGVEAAGSGLESGRHSATLAKGEVGVYHGSLCYLLQDDEGQIVGAHSIGVGLEYPGVSPELSYLKDIGRAEFYSITDQEALRAYHRLCKLEGIIPALEASHALAFLEELCPTLPDGTRVVVCCSGRGEKDAATVSLVSDGDVTAFVPPHRSCYHLVSTSFDQEPKGLWVVVVVAVDEAMGRTRSLR